MKLEDQVVSLDLAKRLKELGVKQDSYFYYEWYSDHAYQLNCLCSDVPLNCKQIAAFTVAELGEMFPDFIGSLKESTNNWTAMAIHLDYCLSIDCSAPTEADGRAKLLIDFLEIKLKKEWDNAHQEREV